MTEKIDNGWTKQSVDFEEVKRMIEGLKKSNNDAQKSIVSLMQEIETLRHERDYLQLILDSVGGRG
jgi:archaellum component FlaC